MVRTLAAPDLRLSDVHTFLNVVHLRSINGASRATGVSPSQLSKSIARLERAVGVTLISRSVRGIQLTEAGRNLAPRFVDLLERAQAVRATRPESSHLTVVAPAFITTHFLPSMVAALPGIAVHSVDAPPGVPSAFASQPLFDVALTLGAERWPDSWSKTVLGALSLGLFASPEKARSLGRRVRPERLRDETFIGPLYSNGGELLPGDDGCPLRASTRAFGHRTQTLTLALSLAQTTSQLVFGPVIAAVAFVARKTLVEVAVEGWTVRESFNLECHQERVSAHVQRALASALRQKLREFDTDSPEKRMPR